MVDQRRWGSVRKVLAGVLAVGAGVVALGAEAAPAAGKGLADPKNDKSVVAAAKLALGCKWDGASIDRECPAYKKWRESALIEDGKADPTLVAMLADPKVEVRWLAIDALNGEGKAYRTDVALAGKVVAASLAEKDVAVANDLGRITGAIDAKATGLVEALKNLARTHALVEYRKALVGSMLFSNSETYFDFIVELAHKEKDDGVRKAAISAPWVGTPSGRYGEVCKMWLDRVDDPVADNGAESAYLCAFYPHGGGCKTEWDALLGKVESRAKAGKAQASQLSSALKYLYDQKEAKPAQKARAVAIARALAENVANDGMTRGNALRFVAEAEGDKAKPLAKKLENDKEFWVKSVAKEILDGKIKKP